MTVAPPSSGSLLLPRSTSSLGDQSAWDPPAADGFLTLPGKDDPVIFTEPGRHPEVEMVSDEKELRSG